MPPVTFKTLNRFILSQQIRVPVPPHFPSLKLTEPHTRVRPTLKEAACANVIERLSELSGPEHCVHVPRTLMVALPQGVTMPGCLFAAPYLQVELLAEKDETQTKLQNSVTPQTQTNCDSDFLVGHTGL